MSSWSGIGRRANYYLYVLLELMAETPAHTFVLGLSGSLVLA